MKIAVFSDLHVEHSNIDIDTTGVDIALFAGDIYALGQSRPNKLSVIDWINSKVDNCPVLFVPGNHDFEASDMTKQWEAWKEASRGTNIHCLWNEEFVLGNTRFLGTPLFTNFASAGNQEGCMNWARFGVGDMKVTRVSGRPLLPEDYLAWFNEAVSWLSQELSAPSSYDKNIVVSHFAPSKKMLNPKFALANNSAYWASDLDDLVALADIWFSGHTHKSFVFPPNSQTGKGCLASNARGVSKLFNVSADPNFSRNFVFDTEKMQPCQIKTSKKTGLKK